MNTTAMKFIDLEAQQKRIGPKIEEAIKRVLVHGAFIMGPEIRELEQVLAAYCEVEHAITCSSGTDALLLPLLAWGVGVGDAVIVPSFTFAATAETVALLGATPVFADIEALTFNLDAATLEQAFESSLLNGLRPVGIIAVDLFGQMSNYDKVQKFATDHGLWLIADAAQSFGAQFNGIRAGKFGDATATSFFPAKPLGCYGDGGAIFTSDDDFASVIRSLRVHGQGKNKYDNVRIGTNARLDTIQAAVLLQKMEIFEDELVKRQFVAKRYSESLADIVDVPALAEGQTSVWAQYTIKIPHRDEVAVSLKSLGIPTNVYYPIPLHMQPAYSTFPRSSERLEVSEEVSKTVLSLPMHPYLLESDQRRVIEAIKKLIKES